jgi:hypothetical protein
MFKNNLLWYNSCILKLKSEIIFHIKLYLLLLFYGHLFNNRTINNVVLVFLQQKDTYFMQIVSSTDALFFYGI